MSESRITTNHKKSNNGQRNGMGGRCILRALATLVTREFYVSNFLRKTLKASLGKNSSGSLMKAISLFCIKISSKMVGKVVSISSLIVSDSVTSLRRPDLGHFRRYVLAAPGSPQQDKSCYTSRKSPD